MGETAIFKDLLKILRFYKAIAPIGSKDSTFFKTRFYIFMVVLSAAPVVGNLLYMWRILTKDKVSLSSILKVQHINGEMMVVAVTSVAFVYNGDKVVDLFHQLGIHKFSEPEGYTETYKRHNKMTRQNFILNQVVAIGRILFNLSQNTFDEAKQKYKDERYFCGLLVPCWFPFEMNFLLKCWMFVTIDLILISYIYVAALGYLTVYSVSELIVLRMKKMKNMLNALDFKGNDEDIEGKLVECIEYHSEIVNLVKRLNGSLGSCQWAQYGLVTVVIALLEYELTVSFNITALTQLLIWIAGEFLMCSAGQFMENEREAMTIALYLTPWYELPIKSRKTFAMFLARMQMTLHFEARPMIHMNYEFLMRVLKGSYSFLMFFKSNPA